MIQTRVGAARRTVAVALVSSAMLLIGLGQGSAHAAVSGSAFGYSCSNVVALGNSCTPPGPTPTVTLASDASNSPQTASAPSVRADAGPATIFTAGLPFDGIQDVNVSTQGTLGAGGSVTSTANLQRVNASGNEGFTASNLSSTCTATETGVSGSTTITGGTLEIDQGDNDGTNMIPDHAPVVVPLPANPAPNTTYQGHIHIGNTTDTFTYVYNEQVVSPGSATVNAGHQILHGPNAVGDLIIGQSVCGGPPDTTAPQTTIDSGPSGTISSISPSFAFRSTEVASFGCRLDGPGTKIGGYGPCTSPKKYTNLRAGSYTFSVRATDTAGNTDPTAATRAFKVVAPAATLSGSKLQRLGKAVGVRVFCRAEACRATARGTVRVPRVGATPARRYRLKSSTAAIAKGKKALLRPRLSLAARTAIRRALRSRRRIVVSLRVTVVDKAGNRKTLGRRVRLKL